MYLFINILVISIFCLKIDPQIYDKLMKHDIDDFNKKFNEKNCFMFCDRAWRYSKLNVLKNLIHPCYYTGNATEIDGNLGRFCTALRWQIESCIGKLQDKFPWVKKRIHFKYIKYMKDILKTMGAISKKFGNNYKMSAKRKIELLFVRNKILFLKRNGIKNSCVGTKNLKNIHSFFDRLNTLRFKKHWKKITRFNIFETFFLRGVDWILHLTERSIEKISAGSKCLKLGELYLIQSLQCNALSMYRNKYFPRLILVSKIVKRYSRGDDRSKTRDVLLYFNGTLKFEELKFYYLQLQHPEYDPRNDTHNMLGNYNWGTNKIPTTEFKSNEINEDENLWKILSWCNCPSGQRSVSLCAHRATAILCVQYFYDNVNLTGLRRMDEPISNVIDMDDYDDLSAVGSYASAQFDDSDRSEY